MPEFLQTGSTTDNVVKAFPLPKLAFAAEVGIDLLGGVIFPITTQTLHDISAWNTNENMDMIRHHHIGFELIGDFILVMQIFSDDLPQFNLTQETFAVIGVEHLMPFGGKEAVKLSMQRFRQLFDLFLPVLLLGGDAVQSTPILSILKPFCHDFGRNGVCCPPSDEIESVSLFPMREMTPRHFYFR
ncbi:MAG: hypothetical protein NTV80_12985 [Verrucomicrobia bacterium]|nr:hypothetical protein [Verrucomicrobiota bacterium]